MCNILKTADRRAKRTKIWDSGTVHIGRILLMPDSLSLVWGHSVHFAKFPMLRGYCSPRFQSLSTKFYCKHVGHEGFNCFGRCAKI